MCFEKELRGWRPSGWHPSCFLEHGLVNRAYAKKEPMKEDEDLGKFREFSLASIKFETWHPRTICLHSGAVEMTDQLHPN